MTVKERIMTIRLSEKINRQPEYANNIGLTVSSKKKTTQNSNKA